MEVERLLKYLGDAIPLGLHPAPHSEWISVRLDVVQAAIEHVEFGAPGSAEWRQVCLDAIAHLEKVLNGCQTHDEQQRADAAGRAFLSIHR